MPKIAICSVCGQPIQWIGGLMCEWRHINEEHEPTPKKDTETEVVDEHFC